MRKLGADPDKNEGPMPSLTLYFIIQPPSYLYMACHLAASIRTHLPADVELIGYCPADVYDQMNPEPLEVLRRLRCKVQRMETGGFFDSVYPHGNKIIATLAPKETDYAAFLDSDMAFLRPCSVEEIIAKGQIGMVPSTSMRWAPQSVWDDVYGTFDMEVPPERITLTRDKREQVVPYFNAGLFVIDEKYRTKDGQRFAEVWMDTAQQLDRNEAIPHRRPYLDQMTLPVATLRAGMRWNILDERYNYSIGGILRGRSLKKDADVTLLHYRNRDVLGEAGRKKDLDSMLQQQIGTRLVRHVFRVPADPDLPPAPVVKVAEEPKTVPDPSKAIMAAMTIAGDNPERLGRWVDYYGDQLGRDKLYVLTQGHSPEIDAIAAGTNVVPLPPSVTKDALYDALGSFASGLTLYYNWVVCTEPDEFLIVDPLCATGLHDYLAQLTASGNIPRVTAPLGFELVNPPGQGPLYARVRRDDQKPCLTRVRIGFAQQARACNAKSIAIDPHLCLVKVPDRDALAGSLIIQNAVPVETLDMPELRKGLLPVKSADETGFWRLAPVTDDTIYRFPARCSVLFETAKERTPI